MAGNVILTVAYGIDVQPENDPYLDISEKAIQAVASSGNANAFIVDFMPWLKYLPSWFPGAGFQKQAQEWRIPIEAMPRMPFNYVKKSMAWSFISSL